jgi:branched-subunit amino acid aminotransferase/4-amino-4-deoxychorismate lyase
MELDFRWDREEVLEMYRQLIERNKTPSSAVRTVVTGGYADDGYTPTHANNYIMLHSLPAYAENLYTRGSNLISVNYQRDVPDVKTTIYTQTVLQRKRMHKAGAIELLYAWHGEISECSRSNIFFVDKDNTIVTPDTGILSGITRTHVLQLAVRYYRIDKRIVRMDEIPEMQEAFITSTTKGIMPVIRIDDLTIGSGSRGQVTADLMERFERHVEEYINNSKF